MKISFAGPVIGYINAYRKFAIHFCRGWRRNASFLKPDNDFLIQSIEFRFSQTISPIAEAISPANTSSRSSRLFACI